MSERLNAWYISFLVHLVPALAVLIFILVSNKVTETYDVPIYVEDNVVPTQTLRPETKAPVVLKSVNSHPKAKAPTRAVFGTSRNTYTSEEGVVDAKRGNTLAKEVDNSILNENDADSLPSPTDEFLVSQMPVVINEIKPIYPAKARESKQEGSVVVDALIDAKGKVRQIIVLEGQDIFREAAVNAMKQFVFSPAQVEGRPVAVRIRYTLNFRLEL